MKSRCVDILPCSFEREGHVKNITALEKWHLILLDQKKKRFLVR